MPQHFDVLGSTFALECAGAPQKLEYRGKVCFLYISFIYD